MIELRLRTKISKAELDEKVGKILTPSDYNVLLTGPTKVLKPDGRPLAVYIPKYLQDDLLDESYGTLHEFKKAQTDNRGLASGSPRVRVNAGSRTRTKKVSSSIIGAFDPASPFNYCRLTAWTGKETNKFRNLFPLFQSIGKALATYVPERYDAQMSFVHDTKADWVIEGTPFTTITVNNSYATGVHQDKGDLDEGFSCLAVLRKGEFTGGHLTFPEWRTSVNMQHGDVLLMDAHEWHGNTALNMESEDAERISVVCYYRTNMTTCGTMSEESQRAQAAAEKKHSAV